MNDKDNHVVTLIQLFHGLSQDSQQIFLTLLSADKKLKSIIETKPVSACPHCGSSTFKRNGTRKGTQRYLCSSCNKSFLEKTNTVLSHAHKDISVWRLYIHCMTEKYSLRKTARICGISVSTALLWRHKILDALQEITTNAN